MKETGRKRILIIEDDAHIAEGLRLNLSLKGHDAAIALDGPSGLRQWREWRPDLIVLDWEILANLASPEKNKVLSQPGTNLAFVRGALPKHIKHSLVPLRGGPHAQLALRLALALPGHDITALHISPAGEQNTEQMAPFQGLARILPSLP